jgi:ubiquinone/menaquinone biosynthesis C-methylase UbiE
VIESSYEWKQWGLTDPMWGSQTSPERGSAGKNPWTEEEFYQRGSEDFREFWPHLESYKTRRDRVLEIGCGAGRFTKQLTNVFAQVDAIDISPEMISFARPRMGSAQVNFHLTDGMSYPFPGNSFDAVFSTHTFNLLDHKSQLIDSFRQLHRVLNQQGVLMVQVSLFRWPGASSIYGLMRNLHAWATRQKARWQRRRMTARGFKPYMTFLPVEQEWLNTELEKMGYSDIQFRSFRLKSNHETHCFVLAKKGVDL